MKWLKRIGITLLLLIIGSTAFVFWQFRDRHPDYWVDINIQPSEPAPLKIGFAAYKITPEIPDTWSDKDGNFRYEPENGDTYTDGNGNGQFDPVWIAGFHNHKPAIAAHDDLWSRTFVIEDDKTRMAVVALDVIGLGSDEIITIRKSLSDELDLDYVIISSSHTHDGPDVIGMWGDSYYKSGVDKAYIKWLQAQVKRSIESAIDQLRPAKLQFAQNLTGAKEMVEDTRPPIVFDPALRLIQAIDAEADTTLGTVLQWSNHPETIWADNLYLSSDFVHYFRAGVEKGIYDGDSVVTKGVGGVAVFLNGSIGGLMTTSPELGIKAPFKDTIYQTPSFDKVEAQGTRLAMLALEAFRQSKDTLYKGSIGLRAISVELPMENPLYRLGGILGVLDKGYSSWMKIRSEVCAWTLGEAIFLHQPGELYPEILIGGIETPEGQDFNIKAIENPPLNNFMTHTYQFHVGLSNDMIGYIIPKSQWDESEPYTYQVEDGHYGEINSIGPEAAPILYDAMKQVLLEVEN